MATQLINILSFTGLTVGVPVAIAHQINFDGKAVIPDVLLPSAGGFTITADDTNVTVTRTSDAGQDNVQVLAQAWHSLVRAFGATNPTPGVQPEGSLTPQPFVLDPVASGATGRYALPEQWFQDNVAASQVTVSLGSRVSQLAGNEVRSVRAGSITGLVTRFSEVVTAGTLTIQVRVNGAPVALSVVSTSGSNAGGGQATEDPGVITFAAGAVIGTSITTDAGFLPNTLDAEAWVEINTD